MVWGLDRLLGRGESRPQEETEPEEGKKEKPRVWRTTPAPERVEPVLTKGQLEAIDTATIRAQTVLTEIDSLKKIKLRGGSKTGVSYYDAGRIKTFAGYVAVLEHGTPELKVEAAMHVLHEYGDELMKKHAGALERLHRIDLAQGNREVTPGVVETVDSIGEEIQQIEADLADIKMAMQTLAGRT